MLKPVFAVLLSAVLFLSGCAGMFPVQQRPEPPAPCSVPVSPIRYNSLIAQVTITGTYTMKDLPGAQQNIPKFIISRLNEDGSTDGNSFSLQNGQQMNFWYQFTVSNTNEQYTASLRFGGWGHGFVHQFYTQYSYTDPGKMLQDLTDQSYEFIHGGWHDSRPNCPQS